MYCMKKNWPWLIVTLICGIAMVGCGNKGDLYIPDQDHTVVK